MEIIGIQSTAMLKDKMQLSQQMDDGKSFETSLENAINTQDEKALKEACDEMEQYMLSMIFKQMKASTGTGEGLIPKGDYEEMFEDQLIDEQCKAMTDAGGVGLSNMMYKQLTQAYGNSAAPKQFDAKL